MEGLRFLGAHVSTRDVPRLYVIVNQTCQNISALSLSVYALPSSINLFIMKSHRYIVDLLRCLQREKYFLLNMNLPSHHSQLTTTKYDILHVDS